MSASTDDSRKRFQNISSKPSTEIMRYLIIIEKSETGYSAYSPDLPGCVSTGKTPEDTESSMREAIKFHIDGLKEEGYQIPKPTSRSSYVEIAA